MTTSEYNQLQENFKPTKLIGEALKIHKDISEIIRILSLIPFNYENCHYKIISINTKHLNL